MLNYRRVIRVGGGSLFKPDNAASYKNYPLSLRLFYENAAIKVTAYYPLYELQNSLYSSISKQEPSLTMHLLPDCRVLFLNTHKVMFLRDRALNRTAPARSFDKGRFTDRCDLSF